MKYTLHDNTAYGIYNGISDLELRPMLQALSGEYGLSRTDYDPEKIAGELTRDADLKAAAEKAYRPFPPSRNWGADYRRIWDKLVAERQAPGYGDVPDDLVEQKVREVFARIVREVVQPRLDKLRQEEECRKELLSHVVSIETEEMDITDEGGPTKKYVHTVTMPSKRKYVFIDRNVFDVGRTITCGGMLLVRSGDGLCWMALSEKDGWTRAVSASEDDESVLAYQAASLFGHYNCGIRM